jgi:hypothetical protein
MVQLLKKNKYGEKYKSALAFASSKGLLPGASFWNGRPLPNSVEHLQSSFHRIMGEETEYLAEMMMRGELTEHKPRSLYAKLLSGKNVFSKYHPMLSQSKKVYGGMTEKTNRRIFFLGGSFKTLLRVPVVVEGTFDLCDSSSVSLDDLTLLHKFISMTQLPDLLTDLLPEEDGPNSKALPSPSFHFQFIYENDASPCTNLSRFFQDMLNKDCDTPSKEKLLLQNAIELVGITSNIVTDGIDPKKFFTAAKLASLSPTSEAYLISILKPLQKSSRSKKGLQSVEKRSTISVNGRVLTPFDPVTFSVEDIKILVQLEWERSRALAFSLHKFYFGDQIQNQIDMQLYDSLQNSFAWAVSDASRFLGQIASSDRGQGRIDVSTQVKNLIDSMTNPCSLIFSWNFNGEETIRKNLKVKISSTM